MLYSIAIAISSLCSSNFTPGGLDKLQCQDEVIACVLKDSRVLDSVQHQERILLKCYLKWRKK